MRKDLREYIISERFIHDDLLKDGEFLIKRLYDLWKRDRRIDASLILWPAHPIRDDEGGEMDGIVAMGLPAETELHKQAIRAAVDRTAAYALFYAVEGATSIKVLLESPHGTRTWTLPIKRSADMRFLGKAKAQDNQDYLGLLWVPTQGHA